MSRRLLMLLALATLALVAGALAPAAGAARGQEQGPAEARSLTATPRTGLADGDRVTASGTGWRVGAVWPHQCTADGTRCVDLDGYGNVRANGTFTVGVRVSVVFQTRDRDVVDCRIERCVLGFDEGGEAPTLSERLRFDPAAEPRLAASPSTDLVDGQTITVTGSRLAAGSRYQLYLCRVEEGGCWNSTTDAPVTTDEDGSFSTQLTVLATTFGVDCRVDACSLSLLGRNASGQASLPVAFRPDGPLRFDPTVVVEPSGPYADGQATTITGAGWEPGVDVDLYHCMTDTYYCLTPLPQVTADEVGAFTVEVRLEATTFTGGGATLDCRTVPCALTARSEHNEVVVPLPFDPDQPLLPKPQLTVTPSEDLLIGQEVEVTGWGFEPGRSYRFGQCDSARGLHPPECGTGPEVVADAEGRIARTIRVAGSIFVYHGTYSNCLRPGRCFVGVADDSWRNLAFAPLHLRPEGDEVVHVAPRRGLEAGDLVTIEATGLNPGTSVDLAQCVIRNGSYPLGACTRLQHRTIGPEGTVLRRLRVQDSFVTGFGSPARVDCRVERCVILVGGGAVRYEPDYYGRNYHWLRFPLHFSPEPR